MRYAVKVHVLDNAALRHVKLTCPPTWGARISRRVWRACKGSIVDCLATKNLISCSDVCMRWPALIASLFLAVNLYLPDCNGDVTVDISSVRKEPYLLYSLPHLEKNKTKRWSELYMYVFVSFLKTVDTISNCQRPLRSRNQIRGKLLLSQKLRHFRESWFSQFFILSTAPLYSLPNEVSCW